VDRALAAKRTKDILKVAMLENIERQQTARCQRVRSDDVR
jgi:hypothetical protein